MLLNPIPVVMLLGNKDDTFQNVVINTKGTYIPQNSC